MAVPTPSASRPPQTRLGVDSVLGCVDVGQAAYWWDYGRLELYMANNLFITQVP